MAGAPALMVEFPEEVAVGLCMVVFACSAALVLVEILGFLAADHARPTGSLARREPLREAPALSEVASCAPRRGDRSTQTLTTMTTTTTTATTIENPTTTGDVRRRSPSRKGAPARTSGPAVIQRRARASEPRARAVLPTAGGPAMSSTAAGARGSSAQSSSRPEKAILPSIPEDQCIRGVRSKCACREESPTSPSLRTISDFKAAVAEGLRVECESVPDDASRNIRKSAYQPRDASRSATKDQAEDASLAGPRALGARPRTCRISPSLRVTLHASLPRARANKEGFEARASIELPEDGSPAQLHFRRGGVTVAFLVLDGASVTASLITTASPKAHRGVAPNASQLLKLSYAEGTCDVYACADLGWGALLPRLYT